MLSEAMKAGLRRYLEACENEDRPCPICETWLERDCRAGRGCPQEDGMNGAAIRDFFGGHP
jgi:hypothetical protein